MLWASLGFPNGFQQTLSLLTGVEYSFARLNSQ